jgi:glycosyltransferase involved in cell wall biosynthesis
LKKIVFLYSEIAEYVLACLRQLTADYPVEIHLVRWDVNPEAPFKFTMPPRVHEYIRSQYTNAQLMDLVKNIDPDLIVTAGWVDKSYLKICRHFKNKIPTLAGIDTQYEGTWRQRLAAVVSPWVFRRAFSHAFVAGNPQRNYALALGFAPHNILDGYYTADHDYFTDIYNTNAPQKQAHFPRKFIFVGRYMQHKGIFELWQAFIDICNENPHHDWQLWCLGTGDLQHKAQNHPKIKHCGFVQPKDLSGYMAQTGVFILPSHYEPWGVVVHEFAAAGFALLCSDRVGAASAFLQDGVNGYTFAAQSADDIKGAMQKIMEKTDQELWAMCQQSHVLSGQITPKKSAAVLWHLANGSANGSNGI